jgi:hypothetical protein
MTRNMFLTSTFVLLSIVISACGAASQTPVPTPDTNGMTTLVAKTLISQITETANAIPTATQTSEATDTPQATDTPESTLSLEVTSTFIPSQSVPTLPNTFLGTPSLLPSLTPLTNPNVTPAGGICDDMVFMYDVNIPDGSQISRGDHFLKLWVVKNTGYCTWSEEYWVINTGGDQMGYKPHKFRQVAYPSTVQPGELTQIGVGLIAPDSLGDHYSYFQFMNDKLGTPFGSLLISIKVVRKNK